MNIYTQQLKQSIKSKLDNIEDAEYLSSLDAILTYETYGSSDRKPKGADFEEKPKSTKPLWKKLCLL